MSIRTTDEQIKRAVAVLAPAGTLMVDVAEALGIGRTRCAEIMAASVKAGQAFGLRIDSHTKRFFPTLADWQVARDAQLSAARERQRERDREREKTRIRSRASASADRLHAEAIRAAEAEIAKVRRRHDAEAKAAEAKRVKAELASLQRRLKAATKQAGKAVKLKGTRTAAAPKPAGPARLPGDPVLNGVQIQRAPTPRDRFAVCAEDIVRDHYYTLGTRPWAEAAAA